METGRCVSFVRRNIVTRCRWIGCGQPLKLTASGLRQRIERLTQVAGLSADQRRVLPGDARGRPGFRCNSNATSKRLNRSAVAAVFS